MRRLILCSLAVFVGLSLCGWGAFGWIVTSATGVMSGEQKAEFTVAMLGGAAVMVAGVVIAVRNRPRK